MNKNGHLRKTNFSGGADPVKWVQVSNADGTVSYQIAEGKFKGYFMSLEGDRVCLDKSKAASVQWDAESLILKNKDPSSGLHDADMYMDRNTGYFYFGFDDMDKYEVEKKRWENPQGIEKLGLTPDGWLKKTTEGYERVALRHESKVNEHSPGLI